MNLNESAQQNNIGNDDTFEYSNQVWDTEIELKFDDKKYNNENRENQQYYKHIERYASALDSSKYAIKIAEISQDKVKQRKKDLEIIEKNKKEKLEAKNRNENKIFNNLKDKLLDDLEKELKQMSLDDYEDEFKFKVLSLEIN